MSVDKLVDSTLLDAACTYEAGKIREKLGSSAQIAYDLANGKGFGDAIAAIPSGGGGWSADQIASLEVTSLNLTIETMPTVDDAYTFSSQPIETISAPNLKSIGSYRAFYHCYSLRTIIFPELTSLTVGGVFAYSGGKSLANTNCILVFPKLALGNVRATFDRGNFLAIDIGPNTTNLYNDTFYNNAEAQTVGTLILRRTAGIVTASTIDTIKGLRDVYVPSALINQYKAATNWSTRFSGGYITFHAIEGSQYANAYADGTPIT